jgi:hypothetical protein
MPQCLNIILDIFTNIIGISEPENEQTPLFWVAAFERK